MLTKISLKYEIPPSQIRSAFPIYKVLSHKTKSEYLFLQGLRYDGAQPFVELTVDGSQGIVWWYKT